MGNKQDKPPITVSNMTNASASQSVVQATSKPQLPFSTVLIANRGEIALRLIRAVHSLGLRAVAVFVADDASSPHLIPADIVIPLGSDPSSYSDPHALLKAANAANADAVLPGYGFVSENPDAAALFEQNGLRWIGPTPETIQIFGLKHTARKAAEEADVPTVPGSPVLKDVEDAMIHIEKVGFPALVKASAGGGGMGQAVVRSKEELERAFTAVVTQAESLFASCEIYLERYVEAARHIEVQVFGDGMGKCVALGDRDCSVQRRRQKVIEEGCAPNLQEKERNMLRDAAARLCAKHKYRSAGTVEFIVDSCTNEWYFLEVNTRLQVEHGVTELVSGIDIVQWMVLQAAGVDVFQGGNVSFIESGVAIEARIYAENPVKDYVPCPGTLSEMVWPEERVCEETGSRIRVDSWAQRGTVVPPHYDPLLGKVLVWARTRAMAIMELKKALEEMVVRGVVSNIELLQQVISHPAFLKGVYTTGLLNSIIPQTRSLEVLKPGLQTSLQDYPGRIGYWNIGVSPSGPMDAYAMGMANALVGNPVSSCAMEITMSGPTLLFHTSAVIAITGGHFHAELDDGKPVDLWTPVRVKAGSILTIGSALGREQVPEGTAAGGSMAYLAVRDGFDVPKYLGSASTFPTGKFGGLNGAFLAAGDFLPIAKGSKEELDVAEDDGLNFRWPLGKKLPAEFIPSYDCDEWKVAALNGPHASEDFLDADSISKLWTTAYTMHHAKNRLGARLIGPAPKWTRADGGSAGLHPSNLHDYTYAPGAVNLSGNTPIVLMMDGPSLGGFVCPITVASADLWKVAQVKPGERVQFKQVDVDDANLAMEGMEEAWQAVMLNDEKGLEEIGWRPNWVEQCPEKNVKAILADLEPEKDGVGLRVVYRMSGDEHVLIEYGEIELDLAYRLRVHMLMEALEKRDDVRELCPGVRSLLVRYDRKKIHINKLLKVLIELEKEGMRSVEDVTVPSRVLRLPLAFADQWTVEAQARYLRSVRPDAPYMPSNVEFVRRINGLEKVDDVKHIMASAEYMVLGLGDVYLGAPCAVPVDPRHRLVTSKYNPARTYTPEGAVGIGGAYMCIYGMDSPGGYQLCGRTLPIWDNYGTVSEENRGAAKNIPWLLRFFDRVTFFPVSDDKLEQMRAEYRKGRYRIEIREESFSYREHVRFLKMNHKSIEAFESKRKTAYDAERKRWEAEGEGESNAAAEHAAKKELENGVVIERPAFSVSVTAGVAASVWAVYVKDGDIVEKGQLLVALESMKVEIGVEAPQAGVVKGLNLKRGESVGADREICIIIGNEESALGEIGIERLSGLYRLGTVGVEQVAQHAARVAKEVKGVFTHIVDKSLLQKQADQVEEMRRKRVYAPLLGVPFAISDDVQNGQESDPLVQVLQEAGAILVGKTAVDDLNAGHSGLESGMELASPLDESFVAGGNGAAAVAVRKQVASFAIVIDRYGTSTIAPALCGVVGMKVTNRLIPTSTECAVDSVGIYGNSAKDVERVLNVLMGARKNDTICRPFEHYEDYGSGVHVNCLSNVEGEDAEVYKKAVQKMELLGVPVTYSQLQVFEDVAQLCEDMPLQYAMLPELHERAKQNEVVQSVQKRFAEIENMSTTALAEAFGKLEKCKQQTARQVMQVTMLPVSTQCRISNGVDKVQKALSRYARVVAALDLCSVTLPVDNGSVGGVILAALAFHERELLQLAARWSKS